MDHLVCTTSFKLMRTQELLEEARNDRFWNQQRRRDGKTWRRRLIPQRASR